MIEDHRIAFIKNFAQHKHEALLQEINNTFHHVPPFRISETPIFIPKKLTDKLIHACQDIMSVINQPNFKELTEAAFFDADMRIPNEDEQSKFIQLDFGICLDDNGEPTPKLIELQGFPSLYFYNEFLARLYRKYYDIPYNLTIHPEGLNAIEFQKLLREEIVGNTDPKQIILLEIEPDKQATAIDFYCTEYALGIKILCISQLIKKGKQLFYLDESGNEIQILKIYNRIIFDELNQRDDLKRQFSFQDEVDVEWIGHPNWFFRISKYTMPLLKGDYVPKSYYLDQLEHIPKDLENYVLKPLYSFAGAGVEIHVTQAMINNIKNKSNYLLQEKVAYHPLIKTLDEPAKCEVRMMLMHCKKDNTTKIISNLVRLTKGEMVGVKYNKDKTWVGGSAGFFEI